MEAEELLVQAGVLGRAARHAVDGQAREAVAALDGVVVAAVHPEWPELRDAVLQGVGVERDLASLDEVAEGDAEHLTGHVVPVVGGEVDPELADPAVVAELPDD